MSDRHRAAVEVRRAIGRVHQDPDALETVIARSAPLIWRACAALAGPARAEDLTIRTFRRGLDELRTRDIPRAPIGWLLGIACRTCAAERDSGPDEHDGGAPTRHWLDAVLGDVPSGTREAFLLTALAGFSYIDVAVAYDCPLETVHARVASGRRRVIAALGTADGPPGTSVAW